MHQDISIKRNYGVTEGETMEHDSSSGNLVMTEQQSSSEQSTVSSSQTSQSEQDSGANQASSSEQVSSSTMVASSEQVSSSTMVASSEHVSSSTQTSYSEQVDSSIQTFNSEQVASSTQTSNSEQVDSSTQTSNSGQVDSSIQTFNSEQVASSTQTSNSEQVDSSIQTSNSEQVDSSTQVSNSEQVSVSTQVSSSEQGSSSTQIISAGQQSSSGQEEGSLSQQSTKLISAGSDGLSARTESVDDDEVVSQDWRTRYAGVIYKSDSESVAVSKRVDDDDDDDDDDGKHDRKREKHEKDKKDKGSKSSPSGKSRRLSSRALEAKYNLYSPTAWDSLNGYGTTFDISSSDGREHYLSGSFCGEYSSQTELSSGCKPDVLPEGTYVWRVSGAQDVYKDEISWDFCSVHGSSSTEVKFQVDESGKCIPLDVIVYNGDTYLSTASSESKTASSPYDNEVIKLRATIHLSGLSADSDLTARQLSVIQSSIASVLSYACVSGNVEPESVNIVSVDVSTTLMSEGLDSMLEETESVTHHMTFEVELRVGLFGYSDTSLSEQKFSDNIAGYVQMMVDLGIFQAEILALSLSSGVYGLEAARVQDIYALQIEEISSTGEKEENAGVFPAVVFILVSAGVVAFLTLRSFNNVETPLNAHTSSPSFLGPRPDDAQARRPHPDDLTQEVFVAFPPRPFRPYPSSSVDVPGSFGVEVSGKVFHALNPATPCFTPSAVLSVPAPLTLRALESASQQEEPVSQAPSLSETQPHLTRLSGLMDFMSKKLGSRSVNPSSVGGDAEMQSESSEVFPVKVLLENLHQNHFKVLSPPRGNSVVQL